MAHSIRIARAPSRLAVTIGLLLATIPAAALADPANYNRTLGSSHQPVVSRTDFSFDVAAGPGGLAHGEAQRLDGWFDSLALGYGDTVTVSRGGWDDDRAASGVGAVLSRYGMLLSAAPTPASVGVAPAGAVRVVVSRAVARVDTCPDWSIGNFSDFEGRTTSNFGCATARNLATTIANPQDLVEGAQARPGGDGAVSVKAVGTWRAADVTGKGGLRAESSKGAR